MLASRKLSIEPKVGDDLMIFHRREAVTDAQGRVELSGIVPGLVYHLSEVIDRGNRNGAMAFGPNAFYDETLVLAPIEHD